MIASLPMYPFRPEKLDAFWQRLRAATPAIPLPCALSWPDELLPHWQRSDLLLSQTCGYPLMTALPQVQVIGAFHYAAPGCEGANYRSWIVVRKEEAGRELRDFRGRILACNSQESYSGWHALMRLTGGSAFFSRVQASGSHRRSLAMLRNREADIAAIDCVSWALLSEDFAGELSGLKIVGQTASVPGLPLIASPAIPAESVAALRVGLAEVTGDRRNHALADGLKIRGFSVLPREAWQVILDKSAD